MANWTEIRPGVYQSDTGTIMAEVPDHGLCLVVLVDDIEVLIPIEDFTTNPFQTVLTTGADGKIDPALLPDIAIKRVFTVGSESEQVALTAQVGDMARRSDENNQFYVLAGDDPSIFAQWLPIAAVAIDDQARASIATEIQDRTDADTALSQSITTEIQDRTDADTALSQSIADIETIIGSDPLDTTAQDLTGAVNELKASEVSFDNLQSLISRASASRWIIRQTPNDYSWVAVEYGNGVFVAVASSGTGNRVMISKNGGYDWTAVNTPADYSWNGLAFGLGYFVAVASSGTGDRIMISTDGENWALNPSPADLSWYRVRFLNNKFVAVAFSGTGNRVMYSDNVFDWYLGNTPADHFWRDVAYGNGVYVAVSSNGTMMSSVDAIDWNLVSGLPVTSAFNSITYGNGTFVAVAGSVSNNILTSPDGANWTLQSGPSANGMFSITYGNGAFVAVALYGTIDLQVVVSTNGIAWYSANSGAVNSWTSVTFGQGKFVAVSYSGTGNRAMVSSLEDYP